MNTKVWIALGGNIGESERYLKRALQAMESEGMRIIRVSSFYKTKPYGKTDQADFLNAVCIAETDKEPDLLMETLLAIEAKLGRVRTEKWGARTIDLDMLFYGNQVINTKMVTVPHPEIPKRRFVLEPLAEITPRFIHPTLRKTASQLLFELDLKEQMEWLEGRSHLGIKLGLETTKRFLEKLGNPQKNTNFLHVAGTNGKGSLCAYLSSVLSSAGYSVGLFTSPAIDSFYETFQINHKNIRPTECLTLLKTLRQAVSELEKEGVSPTYFEVLVGMAFHYFSDKKVDYAVVEVGMGGLEDSTNSIEQPLACFINTIAYDHTDKLGDTLGKIAEQKGGIIKEQCPVFLYPSKQEALSVLTDIASKKEAPCSILNTDEVTVHSLSQTETTFSYRDFHNIHLSMVGEHQANNAALAILGLDTLRQQGVLSFTDSELYKGLENATLPGRFEVLQNDPLLIIDGAHNADGINALKETISAIPYQRLILGMGILKDKDYTHIVETMAPLASKIVVSEVDMTRALPCQDLKREVEAINPNVEALDCLREALDKTLSYGEKGDLILWCGSLYLVSEIRKKYLVKTGQCQEDDECRFCTKNCHSKQ